MTYLEPALPVLLLLGFAGLVRTWRGSVPGHRPLLLSASLLGIFLLASNWVAWGLSWPLEMAYSRSPTPMEPADAIVVLSGAVDRPTPAQPYFSVSIDTYRRLRHGVWLFRNWKALPILVSGGSAEKGQEAISASMRRFLEAEGVPGNLIWTEDRSQSTHENAVYSAEILHERRISRVVLVVEASSMPRAAASFEKTGIHVVPAAIRFADLDGGVTDVLPRWNAIARNGETLHEVLGLLWYRWRGWI
jgi:uncharacterized SAM-binding protein YcdF (DUF218 family)